MFFSAKTLRLPAHASQLLLKADSARQERSSTALQGSLPTRQATMLLSLVLSVHGQNIFVHCLNEPEDALTR
jgi:hypothetical protein